MNNRPPVIDMRPDGSFAPPPRRAVLPFGTKLLLGAVLVAAVAGSVVVAALAVWVVSIVLPVAIIAAAVAWVAYKLRRGGILPGTRLRR